MFLKGKVFAGVILTLNYDLGFELYPFIFRSPSEEFNKEKVLEKLPIKDNSELKCLYEDITFEYEMSTRKNRKNVEFFPPIFNEWEKSNTLLSDLVAERSTFALNKYQEDRITPFSKIIDEFLKEEEQELLLKEALRTFIQHFRSKIPPLRPPRDL